MILPELIPGSKIDVFVERSNKTVEKLNELGDKTSHWLPAKLLAIVDVPSSSIALQSLLEANGGTPEHGSWDVGWSLAPFTDSRSIVDALRGKVESSNQSLLENQRYTGLEDSSSSSLVSMSAIRVAVLEVPVLNSKVDISGMEGGPVFSKHAHLIGILARPIRRKASGAEIQLVVTCDAILTAWSNELQKLLMSKKGNLDGYNIKKGWSSIADDHDSFNYMQEPPESHYSPSLPFDKALPSMVLVTVGDGAWASGIILNEQGLILTNAHLLEPWRFGRTHLLSGTDETRFQAVSKLPIFTQEMTHGLERSQFSSPSSVKISDASVPDSYMTSTLASMTKTYNKLRVRLDHVDPHMWCDARAVYVSKGPLDIALLQLEPVPSKIYPIIPDFVCPPVGSKAFVIGHGLFGPRSDLLPSVHAGEVAKVVETMKPVEVYGSGSPDAEDRYLPAMLETTAAVHPGASGGAVVNSDGHMIGLITSLGQSGDNRIMGLGTCMFSHCNAKHGGGTIIPHLNFSIPCAALRPIFNFSKDKQQPGMQDASILQAMDKPNELISSIWALVPPPSQKPAPFPHLPKSLMEKIDQGKGSRFAKFLAERQVDVSPGQPPPPSDQPIRDALLPKILPSKL
ncbi:hypothetical protein ACLOJK_039343 [Asimina triloba]